MATCEGVKVRFSSRSAEAPSSRANTVRKREGGREGGVGRKRERGREGGRKRGREEEGGREG